MQLIDYYNVLELAPSASPEEIKKAYRRLALAYHPDKNNNDKYALARFTEIKEAYETLTNPTRKAHYLQQRWYAQSTGRPLKGKSITPVSVLKQLLELDKYVRTLDAHRMDSEGLTDYILELLSTENIRVVNAFDEPSVNNEIVVATLRVLPVLPYASVEKIQDRIVLLQGLTGTISTKMTLLLKEKKQTEYWEKRRTFLVLGIVLLICLLIYILTT